MRPSLLLTILFLVFSCAPHYCYIVRHAEKLDSTPHSLLSAEGHRRAEVLRDSLIDKKIDLIYVSNLQRTRQTAQPLATAIDKDMIQYRHNAVDSMVRVINSHRTKNTLLVGHSGSIPGIILGVTGQKVEPITENEYNHFFIVKLTRSKAELIQKRYGSSQ